MLELSTKIPLWVNGQSKQKNRPKRARKLHKTVQTSEYQAEFFLTLTDLCKQSFDNRIMNKNCIFLHNRIVLKSFMQRFQSLILACLRACLKHTPNSLKT